MRPTLQIFQRGGNFKRSSTTASICEAIERHTKITREHLTPELKLHLLTPDCPLYSAREAHQVKYFEEPFWSIYWPGGQALARYILDEGPSIFSKLLSLAPNDRRKKIRVLDVGAGCGAAAIAAKIAGADYVLANDVDEVACVASLKNAWLNDARIEASTEDLLDVELPEDFDLVLLGDLLYDEEIAKRLEAWLEERVFREGTGRTTEVYLADPGRHGFTRELREKFAHLRTYQLPENVRRENHGYDKVALWKFLPTSQR